MATASGDGLVRNDVDSQRSLLCDNNMVFKLVRQYGGYAAHLSGNDIAAAIAPAGTGATGYTYPILAPLLHGGSTVLLERWNGAA